MVQGITQTDVAAAICTALSQTVLSRQSALCVARGHHNIRATTVHIMPASQVSDESYSGSTAADRPNVASPSSLSPSSSAQPRPRPPALSLAPSSMQTASGGNSGPGQSSHGQRVAVPSALSTHLSLNPSPSRTLSTSSMDSTDSGFSSSVAVSPDSSPLPPPQPLQPSQPALSSTSSPPSSFPPHLPPFSDPSTYLYKVLPRVTCETDYERLGRSMRALEDGCFYYPDLDSDGARALLHEAPEGTFLVRDSSDPRFLFAMTVKTQKGATSVRIQYERGLFQLDCEDHMKRKLPRFETVLDLLDFHGSLSQEERGRQYRWLEASRSKDMVVRLTSPRRHSPPSLAHLARLAVNGCLSDLHLPSRSTDQVPLPGFLKQFLRAYPYKM